MVYPFKLIESKITSRNKFEVEDGVQPTHALFFIKEGNFFINIEGTNYEVSKGDCIILPDYIQFRRKVLKPISFIYIKFTYNKACPFTFELPYGKVEFSDKARFISNITVLEQLMGKNDKKSACITEHLLMDILFSIHLEKNSNEMTKKQPFYSDTLVTEAVKWINEHICEKILIEDICSALGTNASTLNFRFRRETDKSVGQFVNETRMNRAAYLLNTTTYSVSDIALRCGFENLYYFSNSFKKFHGVSPITYRR